MIIDLLPTLAGRRLVLASASPRRIELLRQVGLSPEVCPSSFAEDLPKGSDPAAYCLATAREKALDVARAQAAAGRQFDYLLASDSIVVDAAGGVLEKPADAAAAGAMLRGLAGGSSTVVTAVVLLAPPAAVHPATPPGATQAVDAGGGAPPLRCVAFTDATTVRFADVPPAAVDAYAASGAWAGKAGGYGIQDVAAQFIRAIEGDYYTVMGLPLHRVCAALRLLATGDTGAGRPAP